MLELDMCGTPPRKRHRLALRRLLLLCGALLLGAVALTPSPASAAEVSAALTPSPAPSRELHLLEAADRPARAGDSTPSMNARPLLLGSLLGLATGVGLGYGLATGREGSSLGEDGLNRFFLGMNAGFPLGLWAGGQLSGGEGWFWLTLAGGVPGATMGLLWMATGKDVFSALGLLSALLVTPTLSLVGYALTDSHERSKRAAPPLRVQPLLGASAGQGLVGLQGSF